MGTFTVDMSSASLRGVRTSQQNAKISIRIGCTRDESTLTWHLA
jgi:hypothetical protein